MEAAMYGYDGALDAKVVARYVERDLSPRDVYAPNMLLSLYEIGVAVQVVPLEGEAVPLVALAGNSHVVDLQLTRITDAILDGLQIGDDSETWCIAGHDLAVALAQLVTQTDDLEAATLPGSGKRYEAALDAIKNLES